MRTIFKALATGALVAPAVLGVSGVAAADSGPSFGEGVQAAGADGAISAGRGASAGGDHHGHGQSLGHRDGSRGNQGPSYVSGWRVAGPQGAASRLTASGFTHDGDAYFLRGGQNAGPQGASSSWTGSRS